MKHRISLYRGARDNEPKSVAFTWEDFCANMLPHEFLAPDLKLECDAFSPAFYAAGATRSNANVEGVGMLVADLDEVSDAELETFVDAALGNGWGFLIHTTWSHASDEKPGNCLRAIFPLSREVDPEDWYDVWRAIDHALGNLLDPKCKDPSRLYFGAFAPDTEEDRAAAFSHVYEGSPIDVDALFGGPRPPRSKKADDTPAGPEAVSRDALDRFARALKRKRDEKSQEHGALILSVTRGDAFAEPGERDSTIFRLAKTLAQRWPNARPESIARHFGPSLEAMATGGDDPDVELVAYKIERAQRDIEEERRTVQELFDQALCDRIEDAFGSGRREPYTEEEIKTFPVRRWIIQKGRSYYTLVAGSYRGPYVVDEAQNAIVRDLAPAHTAGVDLWTISAQGERQVKPLTRLVREYGFVAGGVAVNLSANESYFDEKSRTLVEAPCPLRDEIEPKYHKGIDGWLEALAGEKAHLLKAWIANVTRLEVPCTALFMTGHKHTGKNMLPEGLSRLWTHLGIPTPLEDVLGTNFNDAQLGCPLSFADERLPTDHRGRVLNAELRHYIQARRRPLRRKFLSNADMIGAVRLIISANNEEVLATTENLSNHDIGAIVDRYLHIVTQVEAMHYLKQTPHANWVDGDMIAEHALWLRDNFEWEPNGRFLVHGEDNALHSRLIASSGIRSAVLQFCVGYLLDPGRLDNHATAMGWIRVHQNRLCVNVQAPLRAWALYVSNEQVPTTGRLSQAIAALSTEERVRMALPNGKRPNYRVIERDHLVAWAVDKGIASPEDIDAALEVNTEESLPALAPN